jgi:chitin synthase
MLNQEKITNARNHLGSYKIFYSMFKDLSSEDRRRLRLGNNISDYPYLPYNPHQGQLGSSRDITPALAAMGIKPKAISQMWQLLAAILQLGRIEFIDSSQDPTLMATIPRQKHIFDLVADLLGVEEGKPWLKWKGEGETRLWSGSIILLKTNFILLSGQF